MKCPECQRRGIDGRLQVQRTFTADQWHIRRRRVCTKDPAHYLVTLEQPVRAAPSAVRVLKERGGGQPTYEEFSQRRLMEDIEDATLKRLSPAQQAELAEHVQNRLAEHLQFGGEDLGWHIRDVDIREIVESALNKPETRIEHVLYALSIRGRVDVEHHGGWDNAQDFLSWLFKHYPDLECPIPNAGTRPASIPWQAPRGQPLRPLEVRKKGGQIFGFRMSQFARSIGQAMAGRRRRYEYSRVIAEYVIWELTGQRLVLTSQLAAGALYALRCCDDIAYLRWATVNKEYESVTRIRDEALWLVETPSPRIEFDLADVAGTNAT